MASIGVHPLVLISRGGKQNWLIFFFFQAEDGIRDRTVTGVQTCALPIYRTAFQCQVLQPDVIGAYQADDRLVGVADRGQEHWVPAVAVCRPGGTEGGHSGGRDRKSVV